MSVYEELEKYKLKCSLLGIEPLDIVVDDEGKIVLKQVNRNIKECIVPKFIEVIGNGAFDRCKELESIKLNEGIESIEDKAFKDCSKLRVINIPKSLKKIGISAFYNCSKLVGINLDGVEQIGYSAFFNCESLKEIKLNENVDIIYKNTFYNCVSLRSINLDNVRNIEKLAFFNCSSLYDIDLKGVEKIGESAFFNCGMSVIELGNKLKKIEKRTFSACKKAIKVHFGDNIKKICEGAFSGCFKLEKLPDKLEFIGDNAFYNCRKLNLKELPKEVKEIGNTVFYRADLRDLKRFNEKLCKIGESALKHTNIVEFEIDGIDEIPEELFAQCMSLRELMVSNAVKLNSYIVYESSVKEIILKNVKRVDSLAISQCDKLDTVYIGKGLENMGNNIFGLCKSLKTIEVDREVAKDKELMDMIYSNISRDNISIEVI